MCKRNILTIAAVAILALAIGQVQAVTVTVPIDNPGFEDPVLADGEYDYSLDNQGWGYFDNDGEQGSWNPGLPGTSELGFGGNAPEGQNVGWVNPGGVEVPGGFAQVLTDADATLQADTTYTLTVEVGNTPGYPWNGYKVQLLAGGIPHTPGTGGDYTGPVTGGTLLAEDNNSLTIAEDTIETSTVTYTYDPELHSGLLGEPLQIRLLSLGNVAAGDYTEVNFDNVTLSYDGPPRPPIATNPTPADGAMLADIWTTMSWSPGDTAVSHDVYLGENFDDVNDGTADTFRGNQTSTAFFVGFIGNPYPDGLVPGTTYYWRIDEVNDTDPNSPWKGKVWSFWIQPRIAYEPVPADGAKFIDPNADLNWTAGLGAALHYVYFGDNFDDVNSAAEGLQQAATTYTPGTLEVDKTYYWRVDESADAVTILKGDVWSFTIARAGGGLKAEYFNNTTLSGEPVLIRIDPQIDFNWSNADVPGENSPDASINVDNFSARWSGELEVDLTDTYTFHITANNGFRLWLDDRPIVDFWGNTTTSSRESEPIELVGGNTYSIRMEYFEGEDTAIAQLFWENSTREKHIIPQAALSLPVKASRTNPSNGAVDVKQTQILSWSPGDYAASHQVYLGTDEEAVRNADTTSPEYKATKNLGSESYDPPGKLAWHTTYYWRVDEVNNVNPDSPWVGNVWSFTVADFILVDDFEDYNDFEPDTIFDTWMDGWEVDTNGAEVGYAEPDFPAGEHFVETNIVHGGEQSMPYFYDTNFKYSEATYSPTQRDWTEEGVGVLSLWFYGDAANAAERMYVALNGGTAVYHDNLNASQIEEWTEWTIDLQEFTGVDLTNVNTIAIGFGDKNNLQPGGSGLVLFDDIRLYRPAPPEPEPETP